MTIHLYSRALLVMGGIVLAAIAAVAVGLVPASQLLWLGLILVCPLMMFWMMRGMHDDGSSHNHRE